MFGEAATERRSRRVGARAGAGEEEARRRAAAGMGRYYSPGSNGVRRPLRGLS